MASAYTWPISSSGERFHARELNTKTVNQVKIKASHECLPEEAAARHRLMQGFPD